ncbi:MAG: hypothetical protein ACM34K_00585 [Bacillota bacterium]
MHNPLMAGILTFLAGISCIVLFFRYNKKAINDDQNKTGDSKTEEMKSNSAKKLLKYFILISGIYFIIAGLIITYKNLN